MSMMFRSVVLLVDNANDCPIVSCCVCTLITYLISGLDATLVTSQIVDTMQNIKTIN